MSHNLTIAAKCGTVSILEFYYPVPRFSQHRVHICYSIDPAIILLIIFQNQWPFPIFSRSTIWRGTPMHTTTKTSENVEITEFLFCVPIHLLWRVTNGKCFLEWNYNTCSVCGLNSFVDSGTLQAQSCHTRPGTSKAHRIFISPSPKITKEISHEVWRSSSVCTNSCEVCSRFLRSHFDHLPDLDLPLV